MARRLLLPLGLLGAAALGGWMLLRGADAPALEAVSEAPATPDAPRGPTLAGLDEEAQERYSSEKFRRWWARYGSSDPRERLQALHDWTSWEVELHDRPDLLVHCLDDESDQVRECARAMLIPWGERAVRPLLEVGLLSSTWEGRCHAVEVLGELGLRGHGDDAVRALLALLADPQTHRSLREHCALALGRLRPVGEDVCKALLVATTDLEGHVATRACEGLAAMRGDGEPLVEPLLVLLGDGGQGVYQREEILAALGSIGRRPELVLPRLLALAEKLPSDEPAQRAAAGFGAAGLPYLTAALEKGTTHQASFVLQVLQHQRTDTARLADLFLARLDRDPELYEEALAALRSMGPAAAPHLKRVCGYLEDDARSWIEGHQALLTLAAMGGAGEEAVVAALGHRRASVRSAAAGVVADVLPHSRAAEQALEALATKDPEEYVRLMAKRALERMRPR